MITRTTIKRMAAVAVFVPSAIFVAAATGLAAPGVAQAQRCDNPAICDGGGSGNPVTTVSREVFTPGNWAVSSAPANYGPGVSSGTYTLGGLSGASYYQDGISQQVTVPTSADLTPSGDTVVTPETATLTFGISITSNEGAVKSDLLDADVIDNTTGTDQTFFIPSNFDATSGTVQESFVFGPYIGHNITVRFEGLFGGPGTTTFQISNISLKVQEQYRAPE
jgi:hypothetical protein